MNKTQNYSLNQWALEDRIEMKDFNADNAAIEAALSELAAGGSRLDAALAAARSDLEAAMASETKRVNAELAKKALASDLTSQVAALSSGKLQFDTLLSKTLTVSGSSYSVEVPGKEIGNCVLAAMILTPTSITNSSMIYTNTENSGVHHSMTNYLSTNGLIELYTGRTHLAVLFPMKQPSAPIYGVSFANQAFNFFCSTVTYSSLTSLLIKPPSDTTLNGSGTLKIFGVR